MRWQQIGWAVISAGLALHLSGCVSDMPSAQPSQQNIRLTPFYTKAPTETSRAGLSSPTALILTPTPTPFLYTIQADELVSGIAFRFGVTLAQIQAANPGVDLNFPPKNQQLVIPPPAQTPSPELGTPTPAPLLIENVSCYPAAQGGGLCLGVVHNDQTEPAMYITGEFILEGGGTTRQASFTALLDTLPSGAKIPVFVRFPAPFPFPYQVNLTLFTALIGNSRHLEITDQTIQYGADGLSAHIAGQVKPGNSSLKNLAIIAAGYTGGKPAGVRRIEIPNPQTFGQTIPFEIWVYSAGPPMDQVELFAEEF